MTALGPVCIATAANEVPGWDAEVIDENNCRRGSPPRDADGLPDHPALHELRPADMVGLYGGLSSTVPRLYDVARAYKAMGVSTVAGGQHFVDETIEDALRSGIDVVVLGEGEATMPELLAWKDGRMNLAEVRGIVYLKDGAVVHTPAREPILDFDALPLPDYSLVRHARISIYPVGRVRGCVMSCEFCTVKGKPRYASPERLAEQVVSLYETFGADQFFIVDDLFGQDREETLRLCRMLRDSQRRLHKRFGFTVQIRLDKARDTELLAAMREAGVQVAAIGFESPIAEELRAMNKRLDPQEMIELALLYRRAGFWVHGMFIFGYPMDKGVEFQMPAPERVRHFRRFIRRARIDTVQVLLPVPLPGTELTRRLEAQGRIYSRDYVGWEYYDGNFPLFEPDSPMTAEQMQDSIRRIMGRFYHMRHMFGIAFHTVCFPAIVFHLHNLKAGWQGWLRRWRNNVMRFGGWLILRRWIAEFRKGTFSSKLTAAKRAIHDRQGARQDRPGALPL